MNHTRWLKHLRILALLIMLSLPVLFLSLRIVKARQSPCALYESIRFDDVSNAERLINQGLVDQPCRGIYPIHAAAMQSNQRLLQFILNKGVDPNRPDDETGKTPLMWVVGNSSLARTRDVECFDFLLASGADINSKSKYYENSVLNHFASNGNARLINELIEHGANIETQNERGQTPLHTAVEAENINAVEVLLKHGSDTSVVDKNNETPLDIAKRLDFPEIQKLLTE